MNIILYLEIGFKIGKWIFYQLLIVMFNFMCQLNYPDTCSNIGLGIFVRVFLEKFNIEIDRPSKADCPP